MDKEALVELPDMMRVQSWFDANKPTVKCRLDVEQVPFLNEYKVILKTDSGEVMWYLMMTFCIALRKGEV